MIATLEGTLDYRGIDSVIINVGGIGFQVFVSTSTLSQLGAVNDRASLYTHLRMREDNVALYGFASTEELTLFRHLISVSGVGPRLAMALLSALSPEQLVTAIAGGSVDIISQVSGVGKKMAGRLIVELRGKLEKQWEGTVLPMALEDADVVAALTALGYSVREAARVASSLPVSGEMSLQDKVKAALQQLAGE